MNSDLIRQGTKSPNHQMLGIYLHIPFCSAICNYCNFNRGLFDAGLKEQYVDALVSEIGRDPERVALRTERVARRAEQVARAERVARRTDPTDTIYFGGGTPSLLEPAEV